MSFPRREANLIHSPGSDHDPLRRLTPWPGVLRQLEGRDVVPRGLPDETAEALENRLGTGLMTLYRDTRSEASFEALYAFARPAVLLWICGLLRRGRSQLDPAELLQDTFVNVYRYPTAFRAEHAGSFRVWVRTIAGNIVRRASMQRRKRVSFQELPEGLQEPEDHRESPVHQAEVGEQQSILRSAWVLFLWHYARAWQELSDRDRKALHLVEVEGFSYRDAGAVLQVGRSNMKMIVFRARLRIARRMRAAMAGARQARTERAFVRGAA